MAVDVIMPVLGMTMESGVIVEWMKQEGESVSEGDVLFTVETDKSVAEVEARTAGTLLKILHGPGDEIPIQQVIAYIGNPDEALPDNVVSVDAGTSAPVVEAKGHNGSNATTIDAVAIKPNRIKASPKARKRAGSLSIPLDQIEGTGPGGRIVFADVETYAASPVETTSQEAPAALPSDRASKQVINRTPLTGIRKIAATRLTESTSTVPHFYLTMTIDMTRAAELRKEMLSYGERRNLPRISVNDMLIKAAGMALQDVPAVNASLDGNIIEQYADAHVGFAVALDEGLVVPVVPAANVHSVFRIAEITKSLDKKAKEGGLTPEDYGYGTFTISNLGMFGIKEFAAVINPPQSCILAVGKGEQRPVVKDGALAIATMMTCTLSVDHRSVDGSVGANFLAAFQGLLEEPLTMLL